MSPSTTLTPTGLRPCADTGPCRELIEDHLGLVEAVVTRLAARLPRHIDRSELVSAGIRVSVDSFDVAEIRTAVAAGAELVLSVNGSNLDVIPDLATSGARAVVVPDAGAPLESREESGGIIDLGGAHAGAGAGGLGEHRVPEGSLQVRAQDLEPGGLQIGGTYRAEGRDG